MEMMEQKSTIGFDACPMRHEAPARIVLAALLTNGRARMDKRDGLMRRKAAPVPIEYTEMSVLEFVDG